MATDALTTLHDRYLGAVRIGADFDLPPGVQVELDDDAMLIFGDGSASAAAPPSRSITEPL